QGTLGLYFTALQAFEYLEAPFTIADSVYGSTFFYSHRLSWPPCNYWYHFPINMLTPTPLSSLLITGKSPHQ
ncbi:hypothetical protein L9F63_001775, partial [Diploptera punctata]